MKKSIIYNQLYWLLSSDPATFNKLEPYIAQAVAQNPNDWQAAITAVITKAWWNAKTASTIISRLDKSTDDWANEISADEWDNL
jgi:hypothetical protein